eukprot:6188208-Pleurochrysis_carterae.AAC.1
MRAHARTLTRALAREAAIHADAHSKWTAAAAVGRPSRDRLAGAALLRLHAVRAAGARLARPLALASRTSDARSLSRSLSRARARTRAPSRSLFSSLTHPLTHPLAQSRPASSAILVHNPLVKLSLSLGFHLHPPFSAFFLPLFSPSSLRSHPTPCACLRVRRNCLAPIIPQLRQDGVSRGQGAQHFTPVAV